MRWRVAWLGPALRSEAIGDVEAKASPAPAETNSKPGKPKRTV